ncbi:helix-turn-helix domain-containing protein [[Mesomycoplasma] collis]|uniref:hypothetical protein n=1 Tax=[Mycoplasma] collis TaxID=2127 RepID=UPI000A895CF8|nr:hypothetical protein [[Mycoplasma] collis]
MTQNQQINKNKINQEEKNNFIELFKKYSNFLTQSQKQVFELYFFQELAISSIAEIIATTRQAAFDSLKKAKDKLLKIDNKLKGK